MILQVNIGSAEVRLWISGGECTLRRFIRNVVIRIYLRNDKEHERRIFLHTKRFPKKIFVFGHHSRGACE